MLAFWSSGTPARPSRLSRLFAPRLARRTSHLARRTGKVRPHFAPRTMNEVYQKAPAGAAAESEAVDSDEDGDLDADEVRRNLIGLRLEDIS